MQRRERLVEAAQVLEGDPDVVERARALERLGIAYDVHSFMSKHRDTGYVAVYLGVDPKKAVEAVHAVILELRRLCDEELIADELAVLVAAGAGDVDGAA
ncbi:hypothetical protein B4Q13_15120 [Lacticaseibacillus rhamnosus]